MADINLEDAPKELADENLTFIQGVINRFPEAAKEAGYTENTRPDKDLNPANRSD